MPEKIDLSQIKTDEVVEVGAKERSNTVQPDDKYGKLLNIKTRKPMFVGEQYVAITIPKDRLNPTVTYREYGINGVHFKIGLGKVVYVPQSLADLITQVMNDEDAVEEKIRSYRERVINWS
jgi:hypothetical protein